MKNTRYQVHTPRMAPGEKLKIVFLSDLHSGKTNGILPIVQAEAPDMILLGGDIFERYLAPDETDDYHDLLKEWCPQRKRRFSKFLKSIDAFFSHRRRQYASQPHLDGPTLAFVASLTEVAPVYYVPGNHERRLSEESLAAIRATGTVYLSNSSVSFREDVTIGGVDIRYDEEFLQSFSALSGVRILLCHCPDFYPRLLADKEYDLILSGHAHGGQWRFFGKPVFAPGQGLFPKYAGGIYHGNFVVGRGLVNTVFIPRFFNPCEVVTVTLSGEEPKKTKKRK